MQLDGVFVLSKENLLERKRKYSRFQAGAFGHWFAVRRYQWFWIWSTQSNLTFFFLIKHTGNPGGCWIFLAEWSKNMWTDSLNTMHVSQPSLPLQGTTQWTNSDIPRLRMGQGPVVITKHVGDMRFPGWPISAASKITNKPPFIFNSSPSVMWTCQKHLASVLWLWKKTRQDVRREGLIPCTEF